MTTDTQDITTPEEPAKETPSTETSNPESTTSETAATPESAESTESSESAASNGLSVKQQLEDMCKQLEDLITAERHGRALNKVKKIQKSWAELNESHPKETRIVAKRYKQAEDAFYKEYREFLQNDEWERWANFQKKEALCLKVESLSDESDSAIIVKTVQESQAEWKKIGPTPHKQSTEIWDRFKTVCDKEYGRCGDYLEKLKVEKGNNLKEKEALCAKAKSLENSTDWSKASKEMKALQQSWKKVGPVPHGSDRKLYKQFKKSCDIFFKALNAHYKVLDGQRDDNYTKKQALLAEVESVNQSTDWNATLAKIKSIQGQWKEIGPVPRDKDQALWESFKGACDVFFNNLDESRRGNLAAKEELLAKAEELINSVDDSSDIDAIKDQLKGFQKRFGTLPAGPRKEDKALGDKLYKLSNGFIRNAKNQSEKLEEKRHENAKLRSKLIAELEDVVFAKSADERTPAISEITNKFKQVESDKGSSEASLKKQFNKTLDLVNAIISPKSGAEGGDDAVKTLEGLCVRAELLSKSEGEGGADSNLSLAERMRIALQARPVANNSRGNSTEQAQKELRRIKQDWLAVGPVAEPKSTELLERFKRAQENATK